ncbi:protein of unknown function [Nitrosotalea devaniterrae]|uniref:Uncharacterized protein n=1 Tax=Nitrosotalea devaniterrae TaxID=1078905 RepID=A0A128A121_9ARCH|nr:protein of unknown function [Candidatus Nitrosotalea devanaterra]
MPLHVGKAHKCAEDYAEPEIIIILISNSYCTGKIQLDSDL